MENVEIFINKKKELLQSSVKIEAKSPRKKKHTLNGIVDVIDEGNNISKISFKKETKSSPKNILMIDATDIEAVNEKGKETFGSPVELKTKTPRKRRLTVDVNHFEAVSERDQGVPDAEVKRKTKAPRNRRLTVDANHFEEVNEQDQEVTEAELKGKAKASRKKRLTVDANHFDAVNEQDQGVTEAEVKAKTKTPRKKKLTIDGTFDVELEEGYVETTQSSVQGKTKTPRKRRLTVDANHFEAVNERDQEDMEAEVKAKTKTPGKRKLAIEVSDAEGVKEEGNDIIGGPVMAKTKSHRKKKHTSNGIDVDVINEGNNISKISFKKETKSPRKNILTIDGTDTETINERGRETSESPVELKTKTPRKRLLTVDANHFEAVRERDQEVTEAEVKRKTKAPRKRRTTVDANHFEEVNEQDQEATEVEVKARTKTPRRSRHTNDVNHVEAAEEGAMLITKGPVKAKAKTPRKRRLTVDANHFEAVNERDPEAEADIKVKTKTPRKNKFMVDGSGAEPVKGEEKDITDGPVFTDTEAVKEGEEDISGCQVKAKTKTPRKKKLTVDGTNIEEVKEEGKEITDGPVKAKTKTPRKRRHTVDVNVEAAKEGEREINEGLVKAKAKKPRKRRPTVDVSCINAGKNSVQTKLKTPRKKSLTANATDGEAMKYIEKELTEGQFKKTKTPRKRKLTVTGNDAETSLQQPVLDDNNLPEDDYGKYAKYNKDKPWKMLLIPHHLMPSFNVTRKTNVSEIRDFPLLNVSAPHSVYVRPQQLNSVDICHRRTVALSLHMNRLKQMRGSYMAAKKKYKQVRKNEKNGIFNKTLIEFARRREAHPDKYFAKHYDFYYTGGNLCVNPVINNVLHANGNNMESLTLSVFNVKNNLPIIEEIASVNFNDTDKDSSEIFEVKFDRSACNTFFMRRKFCVSMHQYTNNNFYTLKKFNSKKKVPFISFAQDKVLTNHLAVSNLKHVLRVYDLETGHRLHSFRLMEKEEITTATNWNTIASLDRNVYIYAACRKFNLIDTRIPESEWRSNYSGFTEADYCANFSSLAISEFQNLFYIGSSHKVHCVDIRRIGANIEGKYSSVVNWTHQMNSCPLMIATNGHDDCEYIALQSPMSADLRICENFRCLKGSGDDYQSPKRRHTEVTSKYIYKSHCLPYMPKSLENVFHEARRHGQCLRPFTGLIDRVKACTTGLSFVGDSSNPYILTLTSNGDLFARHMFESGNYDSKEGIECAVEIMTRYEENVNRILNKPRLNVTEVCDLSGISKVFRCPALSEVDILQNIDEKQKRRRLGRWQKSIETLRKFKDALVPDLLSIWDIEEEDQKEVNLTALSRKMDAKHIVSSWLNSTQQNAHSTMVSINMDSLNATGSALETTLDETFGNNDTQMESQQTILIAKPKISKKKKSYVKGF